MTTFRLVDNRSEQDYSAYKSCSSNRDIYIAQSLLVGVVEKPEPPTIEEAHDIISWANRSVQK